MQNFQECHSKYDKEFASRFKQFLDRDRSVSLASSNNEDAPSDDFVDDFMKYIETHLQANKCPSTCSRLWSGNPLWISLLILILGFIGGTVQTTRNFTYLIMHLKDY